jgi:two-component system, response regulator
MSGKPMLSIEDNADDEAQRTKRIPIVVLSRSKEDQDLVKNYPMGANSYICKPVDFNEFIETVRQPGNYWLVLNETSSA